VLTSVSRVRLATIELAKPWAGMRRRSDAAAGPAGRLPCGARSEVAPHNSLRSLRSLRSDKCGESDHEARAARAPTSALRSSAPHMSLPAHTRPRLCQCHRGLPRRTPRALLRGGRYPGRAIYGAASIAPARSARAQRAHPLLTRRICSNEASVASVVSYAARARREKRSGVGAQRRPTHHEPAAGTARRAALNRRTRAAAERSCSTR